MESSMMGLQENTENTPSIIATVGPLMFDGIFKMNESDTESDILVMPNESATTIHFTPGHVGYTDKPYVFGRLIDIDGKKLEGVFSVKVVKNDGSEAKIIEASTEKLNFAHPTKPNQRVWIDNNDPICCEPSETLVISLKSRTALDTKQSKIVFEDLLFAEVDINVN